MKRKTQKLILISLFMALAISLSALLGLNLFTAKAAGNVTVNGSNVFTATGEANVIADRQEIPPEEGTTDPSYEYYTLMTFASDADVVSYRRNLAYNWYEAGEENAKVHGMFSMTIGFKNTSFEKFIIEFESQQAERVDKETKTENFVIFYPVAGQENKVYAKITSDAEEKLGDASALTALDTDKITVKFTEKLSDGYTVSVGKVEGKFENVGGNYSKASTSSSSPVYPLSFKARFTQAEGATVTPAQMVLYSLNKQNFKLTDASYNSTSDYYYGGYVSDDTAPVLCLEDEVSYFETGKEIDVNYAVVDVLRTSPKATVNYYVLTYDQYSSSEIDYNDKSLFKEITSSEELLLETGKNMYCPQTEAEGTVFEDDLKADMAVKVYLELTDVSSNGESSVVYLDWYLKDEYKLNIKGNTFIAVAKDDKGVTYNYGADWDNIIQEYQDKIDKLASNISAGSSTYLYLPSVEKLFKDNATAYEDMRFSIYYKNTSEQSNTGLASNNLSINVTRQGYYEFTIYATDLAGNNMYYMDGDEVKTFAATEIWTMFGDEDLYTKLPWFHFTAGYTGVKFEEKPGMQATAYKGTSYSPSSFDINGISGSYETVYRLFHFDRASYYNDGNGSLTYENFVNSLDELYQNPETRKYFEEIPPAADLKEGDENYDLYKNYNWSKSSTSFTPQENNAFYLIRAEVTDTQYKTEPVFCNMGVVASMQAKSLKGESDWVKNNVASVVLLCIAGVALICIVLLLVIKPKNEGDVDKYYESAKNTKKKKNK